MVYESSRLRLLFFAIAGEMQHARANVEQGEGEGVGALFVVFITSRLTDGYSTV